LAGKDDVGSFGRQREVVLNEHLDVVEASLHEVLGENRQASLPRPDLGRGSATTGVVSHLLGDSHGQGSIQSQRGEAGG
jgi:hypothetical protein